MRFAGEKLSRGQSFCAAAFVLMLAGLCALAELGARQLGWLGE